MTAATTTAPCAPASASQETLATMWTVAWTGGMEDPSFQSTTDATEARARYDEWVAESSGFDRVSLIEHVIGADGTVTTMKIDEHCPNWDDPDTTDDSDD